MFDSQGRQRIFRRRSRPTPRESPLKTIGSIILGVLLLVNQGANAQGTPPPITVVVMADQMRADFLSRFYDQFEGGIARLLAEGVVFSDMRHEHAFARTATGHAVLMTGSHPKHNGIPSNVFWDRTENRLINAVEDLSVTILGAPSDTGRSPQAMRRTALGDWLKAESPNSRVFAVSGKDRSGILTGGTDPDGVYWYHRPSGQFVTSTYYRDVLPDWVVEFNEADYARELFGRGWERLLPRKAYERSREDDFEPEHRGQGTTFPHLPDEGDPDLTFYEQFALTPMLDDLTFRFAEQLIEVEGLGTSGSPDLLLLGISSGDYLGHEYGPMSQENQDFVLRLDRRLGEFMDHLDERFGNDGYALIFTSDHGAPLMPEENERQGVSAGRVTMTHLQEVLLPVLQQGLYDLEIAVIPRITFFFPFGLTMAFPEGVVSDEAMAELRQRVADAIRETDWAADAFTYEEVADPETKPRPYLEAFQNNFVADRAPDVFVLYEENFFFSSGIPIDHGMPYEYDTHVPLIFLVPGLPGRVIGDRVGAVDVAPTIAYILGVSPPEEIDGWVLPLWPQ